MESIQRVDLRNFGYEAVCFLSFAKRWRCPIVFLDTEFPGTIHQPAAKKRYCQLSPEERYSLFVRNAGDHRPIQIGITLCHPVFNQISVTWQFDVRDFDVRIHPQAPESIALHESAGIDLERTRRLGVPSAWVARLLLDAGLIGVHSAATWVAFQGSYDFAILLKALINLYRPPWMAITPVKFPETAGDFKMLIRRLFGAYIYDLKSMMKGCGLHGGLESLAAQLEVKRAIGKAHQAGSDSLLTSQVFFRMKKVYFTGGEDDGEELLLAFDGIIAGI